MSTTGGKELTVKVTLRNPHDRADLVDYTIAVNNSPLAHLWYEALQDVLIQHKHLEKNFCFLGFPDTPRNLEYICMELTTARDQINKFFSNRYQIREEYTEAVLRPNGVDPDQTVMNLLHAHFERLQGTVEVLSDYYRQADYETKFAIRQLNILCHEAESLMLSQRKKKQDPQWIRPSQITTFLNCPRYEFPVELRQNFHKSRYDRKFGHVYMHWTQIGKTLYEVYCDENGRDIDRAVCEAITHLRYYSGEFDIEWGRTIEYYGPYRWHQERLDGFSQWLLRNGFDHNDPQYNYGYHELGHVVNLPSPEETWAMLSSHLDISRIEAGDVVRDFPYMWTDRNFKEFQIARLVPGYDYSSRG